MHAKLSAATIYRAARWRVRRALGLPRAPTAPAEPREMVWIAETRVPVSDPDFPTVVLPPTLVEQGRVVPKLVLFRHETAQP
jgi:hypothetical protein